MKFILGYICLFVLNEYAEAQRSNESFETSLEIAIDCKEKNVVSDDFFENFDFQVPTSINESCFLACFEKGTKIMGEDNKIILENVSALLRNYTENTELVANVVEVYKMCNDQLSEMETDECVASEKLFGCIIPHKIEMLAKMNISIEDAKEIFQ